MKAAVIGLILLLAVANCQRDPEFLQIGGYNPAHTTLCFVSVRGLAQDAIKLLKSGEFSSGVFGLLQKYQKVIEVCKTVKDQYTKWSRYSSKCWDLVAPVANSLVTTMELVSTKNPAPVILSLIEVKEKIIHLLKNQKAYELACFPSN